MSWGVDYKYDGYIIHTSVDRLESDLDDLNLLIKCSTDDLRALALTTPPASGMINESGEEGENELWADYATRKFNKAMEALHEDMYRKFLIEQALEVQREHPENVKNG